MSLSQAISLLYILLMSLPTTNTQSVERFFYLDLGFEGQTSSNGWDTTCAEFCNWVVWNHRGHHCINSPCWALSGTAVIYRVVSTVGYRAIQIRVAVATSNFSNNHFCYLQYRQKSTVWWSPHILIPPTNESPVNMTINVEDWPLWNNQSLFEIGLASNGTGPDANCFYSTLELWGVPITKSPTLLPTSQPTITPTEFPSNPLTSSPTSEPTITPTEFPSNPVTSSPTQLPFSESPTNSKSLPQTSHPFTTTQSDLEAIETTKIDDQVPDIKDDTTSNDQVIIICIIITIVYVIFMSMIMLRKTYNNRKESKQLYPETQLSIEMAMDGKNNQNDHAVTMINKNKNSKIAESDNDEEMYDDAINVTVVNETKRDEYTRNEIVSDIKTIDVNNEQKTFSINSQNSVDLEGEMITIEGDKLKENGISNIPNDSNNTCSSTQYKLTNGTKTPWMDNMDDV